MSGRRPVEWVRLSTLPGTGEAELVRRLLDSQGIACRLRTSLSRRVFPFSVRGIGDVEVWVEREERRRAADLIARQLRAGFTMLMGGRENDDAEGVG